MGKAQEQAKLAVECGYWVTFRFDPRLEAEGKVFVFRPEKLVDIERIEKDPKKLKVLYLQGYHDAAINYELLKEYLKA